MKKKFFWFIFFTNLLFFGAYAVSCLLVFISMLLWQFHQLLIYEQKYELKQIIFFQEYHFEMIMLCQRMHTYKISSFWYFRHCNYYLWLTVKKNCFSSGCLSGSNWIYIWIELDQGIRLELDKYQTGAGKLFIFLSGITIMKSTKKLYSRQFFDHPDLSGFFSGSIRMAIRRIEILL